MGATVHQTMKEINMANVLKTYTLTLFVSVATQGAFAAQDDDFVEEASAKGVAEVEAGKLAQEKGSATDVKELLPR